MRTVCGMLRALPAAALVALAIVAGAAARTPAAVQSTSYPWVQLPAGPTMPPPDAAGYQCVQPPAWIVTCPTVAGFHASTGYHWAQPPASIPTQ